MRGGGLAVRVPTSIGASIRAGLPQDTGLGQEVRIALAPTCLEAGWARAGRPDAWPAAFLALVLALAPAPRPALASAWNPPAGAGFLLVDAVSASGADYFDAAGRLAPTRPYAKTEAAAYLEYGLTERLMFVARPSFDLVRLGGSAGGTYRGLGGTSAGAQFQALVFGPAVFAVQGSVSLPGTTSRADPAEIGNTAREFDIRGLSGVSFLVGPDPAFLDVQQAYRMRSGGAAAQWHSDVTFGIRPLPRLLLMVSSVTVVPLGPGTPWFPSARASKVGLKAVYDLTASWSVAIGGSLTVYGRSALRERGMTLGLWHRF